MRSSELNGRWKHPSSSDHGNTRSIAMATPSPTTNLSFEASLPDLGRAFIDLTSRLDTADRVHDLLGFRDQKLEDQAFAVYDAVMTVFERITSAKADGLQDLAVKAKAYSWARSRNTAPPDDYQPDIDMASSIAADLARLGALQA
jgi:hypothetical protein